MARIDGEEIDALARLARLALDADERTFLARQLEAIVTYLDAIAAVDVEGVAPWMPPPPPEPTHAELRPDVATEPLPREDILAAVPVTADGLVVVPRFVES